jgi:hypothetical protein
MDPASFVLWDDMSDADSVVVSDSVEGYVFNKINSNWAASQEFDENFGFRFGEHCLYTFAFNTGQANCVVLRKGMRAVIFDAGGNFFNPSEEAKVKSLLNGVHVDAVFVTHPHEDHFSLLPTVFNPYFSDDTVFFLGGTEADWTDVLNVTEVAKQCIDSFESSADPASLEPFFSIGVESLCGQKFFRALEKKFTSFLSSLTGLEKEEVLAAIDELKTFTNEKQSLLLSFSDHCLREREKNYCGDLAFFEGQPFLDITLLDGVIFKIFNSGISPDSSSANQKSFITKIECFGKSILFTGDAEGEEVERHIGPFFLNLSQAIKLMEISHGIDVNAFLVAYQKLLATKNVETFLELYHSINESTGNVLPQLLSEDLESLLSFVSSIPAGIRSELVNSQLIFLPHHGTNTENSQRWIGYFANNGASHCFVINSSPFRADRIPKRSSIEFIPEFPRHLSHAVVYSQDIYDVQSLRMTNKPVYITGSAPGGVECFLISPNFDQILKLDVARRKDGRLWRWFGISNATYCPLFQQ